MDIVLWLIPAVAFLAAIGVFARRFNFSMRNSLPGEAAHPVSSSAAEGSEAPAPASPARHAAGLPAPVSGRSVSPGAAGPGHESLSREDFERLRGKFRIREISLLPPSPDAGNPAEASLEILVEFEPLTKVGYPVLFGLRQDLAVIVGRHVDVVCKNSAVLGGERDRFARARVLHAA